jgi:ppGpp synthetase/RelA/SpoT-type nucleotidyltranferase
MPMLPRPARDFLDKCCKKRKQLSDYADFVKEEVAHIVESSGVESHLVDTRVKGVDSLRRKLRQKRYSNFALEASDVIGVRVITYYDDGVDKVAEALKRELRIISIRSIDKRKRLSLREFGYRSIHLVACLKKTHLNAYKYCELPVKRFEIQIRSLLEHAWAEIEHEVIYKSGIAYPDNMKRRFASIAGTLEVLDEQFHRLRDEKMGLIDGLLEEYRTQNVAGRITLDVSRLVALLEYRYPSGLGWRDAEKQGRPFKRGLDASCIEALRAVGIRTVDSLVRLMANSKFKRAVLDFAARAGKAIDSISHLAIVVIAVMVKQPRALMVHFPELVFDPIIEQMIQERL